MPTAMDVARYFLATNPPNSISNLKLQKLCAYAQAVAVSYLGTRLFNEKIEMWDLGPVVRELYRCYRDYESGPIPTVPLDLTPFTMEQRLVLAAVNSHYSETHDAWGLCVQSHRDFPGVRGTNQVLTETDLKDAFEGNPLVKKLRRGDATPLPDRVENVGVLSAEEFFNGLDS